MNELKTTSTANISCEFSREFLKLLGERILESLLQSVCSGATLVTGEMSAFYILSKNSVTCIGTFREIALLL